MYILGERGYLVRVIIIKSLDAPKSILVTEKTLKTIFSGQKTPKNPKKTQKTQKNKKTHWAGFFYKKPGFFQP
jgi:hypothetical protein